jgi:hypothetical protein
MVAGADRGRATYRTETEQRVHDADCMAAFGRRWLNEAAEALARFGIPTPPGYAPDEA